MPDNIEQLREENGAKPEDQTPAAERQAGAEPVQQDEPEIKAEENLPTEEKIPEVNPLALSDEDFLKNPILAAKATETGTKEGETEKKPEGQVDPTSPGSKEEKPGAEDKPKEEASALPDAEALGSFYQKVMAPLKANGKEIVLKSPEEAIQLMQMGANYTRKMQELAPHRKVVAMLQNNNIDESRLSFLIDLDKKDPEAIKKLIMDSGIDPLDIDTKVEPAYREGSHKVSDEEVAFTAQLEELGSSETGKATLLEMEANWDQASKDMLWQNPEVMAIIHQQRELGVYEKIATEMARQKTLGKLAPTTPFLEAYKTVGDQLHAAGKLVDPAPASQGDQNKGVAAEPQAKEPEPKPTPALIASSRAAAPKPVVKDSDKAGAAAATRSTPGKAKEAVNFLSMSDEEFMKLQGFDGRL